MLGDAGNENWDVTEACVGSLGHLDLVVPALHDLAFVYRDKLIAVGSKQLWQEQVKGALFDSPFVLGRLRQDGRGKNFCRIHRDVLSERYSAETSIQPAKQV
jgi:hypothetical protein